MSEPEKPEKEVVQALGLPLAIGRRMSSICGSLMQVAMRSSRALANCKRVTIGIVERGATQLVQQCTNRSGLLYCLSRRGVEARIVRKRPRSVQSSKKVEHCPCLAWGYTIGNLGVGTVTCERRLRLTPDAVEALTIAPWSRSGPLPVQ